MSIPRLDTVGHRDSRVQTTLIEGSMSIPRLDTVGHRDSRGTDYPYIG